MSQPNQNIDYEIGDNIPWEWLPTRVGRNWRFRVRFDYRLSWLFAMEKGPRIRLYQQLGDRLEGVADRQGVNQENLIAERFQAYANQLREMAFVE